jgi:hypothetical protein
MALPVNRSLKDYTLNCFTPSIATSPTAAQLVVPFSGRIVKTYGVSYGTTTGTTAVAVAVNGGTAISSAALSIAAGGAGVEVEATPSTSDFNACQVKDGDVISFTPSGGTGSSIGGTFHALIRRNSSDG